MRRSTGESLSSSSALAIAIATALGGFSTSTYGQNADSGAVARLDEVVVTARKRAESIDTVPLAITAMNSEKIEERNLKSIEDVAAFSPGFYTQSQTGTGAGRNDRSFRQLTFRGVGASSTNVGISAAGVAFLDGAPVMNGSLANVQDLERVEVLRGPQSAYFGRSTFIGAINYITKDPTNHWSGGFSTEVAEDNLVDVSLGVSGPFFSDLVSFRLSGRHFEKEGQYKTSNSGVRLGDQGTDSVSLTLLARPTDNLSIRTFANYFQDSDGAPAQYYLGGKTIRYGGANCNLGGTGGGYFCGDVPQEADPALVSANLNVTPQLYDDLVRNLRGFPIPFDYSEYVDNFGLEREALQLSLKADYDFGGSGYTFTSVTAYHEGHMVTFNDLGFRANPTNQFSTTVGFRERDWSQELRLVSPVDRRLRFVAGVNYVELTQSTSGIIGQFGVPGAPFTVFNFSGQQQVGYQTAETPAVFGGVYFDLVPNLTLTVEGRYQADKISAHLARNATSYVDASETFKTFSPRISLDYKLSDSSTVYVLASRGYKPGGFNTALLTQPQFVLDQLPSNIKQVFDEETLDNFEAGIKGTFLEGRLRAALNGYYGKYDNVQIPQPKTVYTTQTNGVTNTAPGSAQNTLSPIVSVGKVDLKGVEFESEALVTEGFRVGATIAYTDTKINKWFCTECASILAQNPGFNILAPNANLDNSIQSTAPIGKRLPGAPRISYTLSSTYERPINDSVTGYIGGDYLYRGSYFADAANIASSGSSGVFNARVGARWDMVNIELYARNLFDDQSPSVAFGVFDSELHPNGSSANTVLIGLPDRRRIGIRANISF